MKLLQSLDTAIKIWWRSAQLAGLLQRIVNRGEEVIFDDEAARIFEMNKDLHALVDELSTNLNTR